MLAFYSAQDTTYLFCHGRDYVKFDDDIVFINIMGMRYMQRFLQLRQVMLVYERQDTKRSSDFMETQMAVS